MKAFKKKIIVCVTIMSLMVGFMAFSSSTFAGTGLIPLHYNLSMNPFL